MIPTATQFETNRSDRTRRTTAEYREFAYESVDFSPGYNARLEEKLELFTVTRALYNLILPVMTLVLLTSTAPQKSFGGDVVLSISGTIQGQVPRWKSTPLTTKLELCVGTPHTSLFRFDLVWFKLVAELIVKRNIAKHFTNIFSLSMLITEKQLKETPQWRMKWKKRWVRNEFETWNEFGCGKTVRTSIRKRDDYESLSINLKNFY